MEFERITHDSNRTSELGRYYDSILTFPPKRNRPASQLRELRNQPMVLVRTFLVRSHASRGLRREVQLHCIAAMGFKMLASRIIWIRAKLSQSLGA